MNWTQLQTKLFIAGLFLFLVFFDVILAYFFGNDATESRAMESIGAEWPIVIVAWYGLSAHFFLNKGGPFWTWINLKPYFIAITATLLFEIAWAQRRG
jgi:hypothetical protein